MFFCFCIIYQQFAACISSSCLVSICPLLNMENHSLLSQKKFRACTSHVSHPFDSVHVLFVALYCVKSQETYRVRRVSFRADLQLRNGVKGPGHTPFILKLGSRPEALACAYAGS